MQQFLIDNILLIGVIIVSAGGLIFQSFSQKRSGPSVSPGDATTLINRKNAQVIDLRKLEEFKKGYIANSQNIPGDKIQTVLGQIDKSRPVLLVDKMGTFSRTAARLLRGVGFTEVYILEGGLVEWQKNNLPLTK